MLSTSDFKRGLRLLVDGEPWTIEDYTVQTPSARGAATLVRTKLRSILTGALLEKTFKSGEKFEEPDVSIRQVQYLYGDGEAHHFMDQQSYEQHAVGQREMGDDSPWLADGMQLYAVFYNGRMVGVNLPQQVEAEVAMAGAGSRTDTASGRNLKDATLANGIQIKVPLFVEIGDRVVVDPRTREFVRRAK
jgi:elongation factor P